MWAWMSMYCTRSALLPRATVCPERSLAVEALEQLAPRIAEDHLDCLNPRWRVGAQCLERLAEGRQTEVVARVLLARTVETIEERGKVEDLGAMLDEVFLEQLPLAEWARPERYAHRLPPRYPEGVRYARPAPPRSG